MYNMNHPGKTNANTLLFRLYSKLYTNAVYTNTVSVTSA